MFYRYIHLFPFYKNEWKSKWKLLILLIPFVLLFPLRFVLSNLAVHIETSVENQLKDLYIIWSKKYRNRDTLCQHWDEMGWMTPHSNNTSLNPHLILSLYSLPVVHPETLTNASCTFLKLVQRYIGLSWAKNLKKLPEHLRNLLSTENITNFQLKFHFYTAWNGPKALSFLKL